MARIVMLMLAASLMAMPVLAAESDAAASGPQWFVVHLRHHNVPGMSDQAMGAAMMGHVEYMNALYDKGILFMAGPYTDDSGIGAGVIQAGSAAEIRASLAQDPAAKAGIFTIESIHPWNLFFNRPMNQRMTMEDFKKVMASGMPPMGDKPMPVEPDGGIGTTPPPSGGSDAGGGMMPPPGHIGFIEFGATDLEGMRTFYSNVFNWKIENAPGIDIMLFFTDPGGMMGGFNTMVAPSAAGPVCYISCEGIAATLARVEAAGGKTVTTVEALPPGMGYVGTFLDPQGNKLGLHSSTP